MSESIVSGEIYDMLLECLHITYTPDVATRHRIYHEAAAGIQYIRMYCDPEAPCTPETLSGQLLCDYVLRTEAGDVQSFASDFAQEITAIKAEYDARIYAEAMGYVQQT